MQEETQEGTPGQPQGEAPSGTPTAGSSSPTAGMEPNVAGALAYLLGPITGIYFWATEKENKFIRFHAMQSILFFVAVIIVNVVLGFIPFLGWTISSLISLGVFLLWLMLMYKAYNNEEWELPVVGSMARQQLGK